MPAGYAAARRRAGATELRAAKPVQAVTAEDRTIKERAIKDRIAVPQSASQLANRMAGRSLGRVGAIALVAAGVAVLAGPTAFVERAAAADEVRIIPSGSVTFRSDANVPGVAIALIAGNPKEGPYTVRAKFDRNVKIPAHSHPDERVVTVISGTYYFGDGDKYDEGAIKGYGPGTLIVVPANRPHYAGSAEDGAIVQESGVGPTGITLTGK